MASPVSRLLALALFASASGCATQSLAERMRAQQVVALVGTPSYQRFVEEAGRSMGKPKLIQGILEELRQALSLEHLRWFQRDRPCYVLVVDPGVFPQPFVVGLPGDAPKGLLGALPAAAPEDARGHLARASGANGHDVYWDFEARYAVLSSEPEVFPRIQGLLRDSILSWQPAGTVAFELDARRGLELVKEEVEALRSAALAEVRQDRPAARGLGEAEVTAFFDGLQSVDWLSGHTEDQGEAFATQLRVTAAPETSLAQAIDQNHDPSSLAGLLPEGAWLAIDWDFDLRGIANLEALRSRTPEVFGEALGLSGSLVGKLREILDELWRMAGRRGAACLYRAGSFPLAFLWVQEVRDGSSAQELHLRALDLLGPRLAALIGAEIGWPMGLETETPQSLDELLERIAPALALGGMSLGKRKEPDLVALTLGIDWDHPALRARREETHLAMLGSRIELAVAYGPGAVALALGPDGIAQARRAAQRMAPGGRALSGGEPRNLGIGFDPVAFGQAFQADPELAVWAKLGQEPWRVTLAAADAGLLVDFRLPAPRSWDIQ
jgi:hypothetical protein